MNIYRISRTDWHDIYSVILVQALTHDLALVAYLETQSNRDWCDGYVVTLLTPDDKSGVLQESTDVHFKTDYNRITQVQS